MKYNENIDIINNFNIKLNDSIDYFNKYINKINVNKISLNILDEINIKFSNKKLPLYKISIITKENSKTLLVNPFDKNLLEIIKNCIISSNLDLSAYIYNKYYIRVTFLEITEEKKNKIIKLIKNNSEKIKISIRNLRREFNEKIKNLKKNKIINENQFNEYNKYFLNEINNNIKYIDNIIKNKEKNILNN